MKVHKNDDRDAEAIVDCAFWLSSIHDVSDRGPVGVVPRIAPDGTITKMLGGLTNAKGLEWGRDGRSFYLADARALLIDCRNYDPDTLGLSSRRRFVTYAGDEGKPHGGAIGIAGVYWGAGIYAGQIHGFSADGNRLQSVTIHAKMVLLCLRRYENSFRHQAHRAGKRMAGCSALRWMSQAHRHGA